MKVNLNIIKQNLNIVIALNLVLVIMVAYSIAWFKTANKISDRYVAIITDMSAMVTPPAPPEISGFPFAIKIHAPKISIAFANGMLNADDLVIRTWALPMVDTTLETGVITLKKIDWSHPITVDSLQAIARYKAPMLHLKYGSLRKGSLDLQLSGMIDTAQKPIPSPDLMARAVGYDDFVQELVRAGVIDPKAAMFLIAGLNMLANDGVIEAPIHQRGNALYAGPLKLIELW